MKALAALSLFLLAAGDLAAQRRGGGIGIGRGHSIGRGWSGHSIGRGTWGWGGTSWGWRAPAWGWGWGGYGRWGLTSGVYLGGAYSPWPWYYSAYDTIPVYQPNVQVVYAPSPAPAASTTVIIERSRPGAGDYDEFGQRRSVVAESAQTGQTLYLVAFRDGVIRTAVSYWTEGATLHYVTPGRDRRSAPLSEVDAELSRRLNRERRVPFSLP